MDKDPKKYEIGFIIKDEADVSEIKNLLSSYKAEIIQGEKMKRVKLGYPIKKETSAIFGYIHFLMDPASANEMAKQLRLNGKILRFGIFNLVEISEQRTERKPKVGPKTKFKNEEEPNKKPELINNELLEKKLEEILK